jgi:SAM-dependent methyltransferase
MNPAEYARMHELEDWYWWYVARRTAAARFLRDHAPPERPLRILDAGCGTGGMLDLYRGWSDAVCVGTDLSAKALEYCRSRGHCSLTVSDITAMPFRAGSFDAVSALDVIEHVRDDERAIGEMARVLRPGGILVASVPAYSFLWGPHDEALHHCRRYEATGFRELIHRSGLRVEKQTYLLTALFPLAAAGRLAARHRPTCEGGAQVPRVPSLVNQGLIGLMNLELAVARRVSLPFGLTVLAVARKPVPLRVPLAAAEEGRAAAAAVGSQ